MASSSEAVRDAYLNTARKDSGIPKQVAVSMAVVRLQHGVWHRADADAGHDGEDLISDTRLLVSRN